MKQIVEFSSDKQTQTLNNILSKDKGKYSVYDIFRILPYDITYDGKRGYLSISNSGIAYISISFNKKLNIIYAENIRYSNTNIFDCFIKALEWFKRNESSIVINAFD